MVTSWPGAAQQGIERRKGQVQIQLFRFATGMFVGVRWSRDRGQKIAQARIGKVKKGSVNAVFELREKRKGI